MGSDRSKDRGVPSRRAFLNALAATGVVACTPESEREPGSGTSPSTPSSPTGPTSSPTTGSTPTSSTSTSTTTPSTTTTPGTPPNILLVFSDQHRGGWLGADGDPVAQTPHMDALAADGVLFHNMFTTGPSCRPARACMMTGRYVHENGVWDNFLIAPSTSENHVRDLRDAGYETAVIGKTHLHDDRSHTELTTHILEEWGFEYIHELVGQNEQTWHETPYSDWLTATTPKGERDKYQRYTSYAKDYDWFAPGPDHHPWNLSSYDHLDLYAGRVAEEWLRGRTDPRPFYLQLNLPGPHKPFDSTAEYRALYDVDDPDLDPGILEVPVDPGKVVASLLDWKEELFTEQESRVLRVTYLAKITMIDEALGGVVQALKDIGAYDTTWIIYCSDHGELVGDHALTGKIAFYEGAIRVPLIVRPPGGSAAFVCEGLIEMVDLPATLRDIAGLANTTGLPGRSFRATVEGGPKGPEAQAGRDEVLSQNLMSQMIRTTEWKLVYDLKSERADELYNLVEDPEERRNLVRDPDLTAVIDDLIARMVARGAPLVEPVVGGGSPGTGDTGGP